MGHCLYRDPSYRVKGWPDGLPKSTKEYVLLQCRPIDSLDGWELDEQNAPRWATAIPGDRFELGKNWERVFPAVDLLEVMEQWITQNPGRWEFRVLRHDRSCMKRHGR